MSVPSLDLVAKSSLTLEAINAPLIVQGQLESDA